MIIVSCYICVVNCPERMREVLGSYITPLYYPPVVRTQGGSRGKTLTETLKNKSAEIAGKGRGCFYMLLNAERAAVG